MEKILSIKDLKTYFYTDAGIVKAVDGVSLDIERGSTLGLVGESGCGKSVTARSILNIVSRPGKIIQGEILYYEKDNIAIDIAQLKPKGKEIRSIRGRKIAMVFQDPMTCLSPVHTIKNQIIESILLHFPNTSKAEAIERAIELLREVEIPDPERTMDSYTFELSGGMRQRAMIAVALAADPDILIADEPTTAVDVTIQVKFLQFIRRLQSERALTVLFITHDLGVIAQVSSEVAVMYLGKVVEKGSVKDIFSNPLHPYTRLLFECLPHIDGQRKTYLPTIEGSVADPLSFPEGCHFSNRCPKFIEGVCDSEMPDLVEIEENQYVRCFLYDR